VAETDFQTAAALAKALHNADPKCENSSLRTSPLIRLICWDADTAQARGDLLRSAGFTVDLSRLNTSRIISTVKENPPAAVVIDLDRLPSHGRAVAAALRKSPSTRRIPLVFAGGTAEKVAIARQELPDAVFAAWKGIVSAVRKGLKNPPVNPVQPPDMMERYAGTALARKLGLPAASPCALIGAPEGFAETIDDLPENFAFQSKITRDTRLIIWFVRSAAELALASERAGLHMPEGASIWIVYPKRSGRLRSDLGEPDVRESGLELGLVDYKICAVDGDWSGMKFTRRKK
jgi:CheY-like chemotaxis protein